MIAVFTVNTGKEYSDEDLLLSWKLVIPWLVKRAHRYYIVCEPLKKGTLQIISLLKNHALVQKEIDKKVKSKLGNTLLKVFSKDYSTPDIAFEGMVNPELAGILLSDPLPDKSLPADISPCAQVLLYRDEKLLFACYDYGVFQTLYLREEEIVELRKLLQTSGLNQNILAEQKGENGPGKAPWFFAGKIDNKEDHHDNRSPKNR